WYSWLAFIFFALFFFLTPIKYALSYGLLGLHYFAKLVRHAQSWGFPLEKLLQPPTFKAWLMFGASFLGFFVTYYWWTAIVLNMALVGLLTPFRYVLLAEQISMVVRFYVDSFRLDVLSGIRLLVVAAIITAALATAFAKKCY